MADAFPGSIGGLHNRARAQSWLRVCVADPDPCRSCSADQCCRVVIDQFQHGAQRRSAIEFRFAHQPRQTMHDHRRVSALTGIVERAAQHFTTPLKLAGQGLPVQFTALKLLISPSLHGGEFGFDAEGQAQIQVMGAPAVVHHQHQKTLSTGHEPDFFQLALLLLWSADQAHQTREIRQPSR